MATANYETVLIAEPEIAADQVETLLGKIKQVVTGQGGTMTAEDRWGKRRLAYQIQGHREGFYVVLTHTAEPGVVAALDHFFNVTDTVIRHMTTKVIKSKKTFTPRRERPAGASDVHQRGGRPGGPSRGPRSSGPTSSSTPPAAASPNPVEAGSGTPGIASEGSK